MKKNITLFICSFFVFQFSFSQLNTKNQTRSFNNIHKESIFIHYNSSLYLTGEYIYFKIYCLNANNNKLSNLSKVAYLDIVNEEMQTVYSVKVKLENGVGFDDYLVNTKLKSGNYKLIAYTNWMKNNNVSKAFFESNITIINPYTQNQKGLTISQNNDSLLIAPKNELKNNITIKSKIIDLQTNKKTFNSREKVKLRIKALVENNSFGSYSLSVKKVDSISNSKTKDFIISKIQKANTSENLTKPLYYPEIRGELFFGKIIRKDESEDIKNKKILISTYNNASYFNVSTTNVNGEFNFSLKNNIDNNINFQILNENNDNFDIVILPNNNVIKKELAFEKYILNPKLEKKIIERSVYNQINNSFNIVKTTNSNSKISNVFYKNADDSYNLDDYTRFKTLKETLLEVVKDLTIRKINSKEHIFKLRRKNNRNSLSYDYIPWVFIDGILIQNHNDIIDYPSKNIKSISLLKDKYLIGTEIVSGIVLMETFNNHFIDNNNLKYSNIKTLSRALPNKNYLFPNYDSIKNDKIPDFRHQLFWKPDILLNKSQLEIMFFTSDILGTYEISIKGVTKQGKLVSTSHIIEVK
ncbi:hypothetical protein BW723_16945 [Polaribacter reichenbachii]|uniref:Uncharacterized protein n=1 Tax=Polaribacter reichenbachii TaxID=996801 RepID=A0A1B8U5P3_9FLAO|nr:hypothetical protein [Polaribacter reichenbachii]APZ47877.1 hypothetical protein BW723_16945 [Polaribacter reichenbachii]AUC18511.1 hypothetical protein BTO17_07340 [Polaribacter reichenbachii]OBY67174.1 hypothetical protein LPB301_03310 [Polaribacter reichenbachii]